MNLEVIESLFGVVVIVFTLALLWLPVLWMPMFDEAKDHTDELFGFNDK